MAPGAGQLEVRRHGATARPECDTQCEGPHLADLEAVGAMTCNAHYIITHIYVPYIYDPGPRPRGPPPEWVGSTQEEGVGREKGKTCTT